MSLDDPHRHAFLVQRASAKRRGVEWQLTYAEWLAWWGDDIERRGSQRGDLCMMRKCDTGPYALGNIEKGDAKANARTAGAMKRKRATDRAKAEREAILNALMWAPSAPPPDEDERTKQERRGDLTSGIHWYMIRG